MGRFSLRTALIVVAVLGLGMAGVVPLFRQYESFHAGAWVLAKDPPTAITRLSAAGMFRRVAQHPGVIRASGSLDPGDPAAIASQVSYGTIPGTKIVQVRVFSRSAAMATAIVNALVGISATDGTTRTVSAATTARRVRPLTNLAWLAAVAVGGLICVWLIVRAMRTGWEFWTVSRPAARRATLHAIGARDRPVDQP